MAHPLPPLIWLRTFEACARHLSFARAADELGLTPAAVGQHIKALEGHLGFVLFERMPRGVRLSTIGRAWFPMVAKTLDDLTIATAGLFGAGGGRAVTVRCSVSFATLCLAPALPAFAAAHPDIPIRIYSSIWSDDLDDSVIDIDVRFGNGRWDGFEARPLTAPRSIPVCPPGAVFGDDPAAALFDLARAGSIQIVGLDNLWVTLSRQMNWPIDAMVSRHTVDTSAIALEMVAAGMGCAIVAAELAAQHLARGLVSTPAGIAIDHDLAHHVLLPTRAARPAAETVLFRDWLLDRFRA